MKIIGITTDDKPVVAGVYKMCGTHGLPLEIVLDYFRTHVLIISWSDFIIDALNEGTSSRTIRAKILSAMADIYGPKYTSEFDARFSQYIP
jgi:hypothetical protein